MIQESEWSFLETGSTLANGSRANGRRLPSAVNGIFRQKKMQKYTRYFCIFCFHLAKNPLADSGTKAFADRLSSQLFARLHFSASIAKTSIRAIRASRGSATSMT